MRCFSAKRVRWVYLVATGWSYWPNSSDIVVVSRSSCKSSLMVVRRAVCLSATVAIPGHSGPPHPNASAEYSADHHCYNELPSHIISCPQNPFYPVLSCCNLARSLLLVYWTCMAFQGPYSYPKFLAIDINNDHGAQIQVCAHPTTACGEWMYLLDFYFLGITLQRDHICSDDMDQGMAGPPGARSNS